MTDLAAPLRHRLSAREAVRRLQRGRTSAAGPGCADMPDTRGLDSSSRALLGLGGLGLSASAVHRDRVGPCEVTLFRAANQLPDCLAGPMWLLMQSGALASPLLTAAAARATGHPELAARLLVSGSGSWALAKLLKSAVRRPRPAALVLGTRVRGREQAGLGYLSGHAAVAAALAATMQPHLGAGGRVLVGLAASVVGLSRMYVGAHLPLDVLGGLALGATVEAAVGLAARPRPTPGSTGARRRGQPTSALRAAC